jgi:hypothetical protein
MEAPKTLRRPANWQDFESLCKKLWGEIWSCPEIQKNGRLGQDQSGVDIFGIPFNEDSYFGIQCKGKSEYNDNEYSHPQFTEKEIEMEIEKAKTFTPALKKFYFATTALADSKTQSYVRQKNIENKKIGLFEVHLFSWESIVDLIDENKQTHDWYVKSQNFKTNKSVRVTFQDDSTELKAIVKFKQKIIDFRQKAIPLNPVFQKFAMHTEMLSKFAAMRSSMYDYSVNHSNYEFSIIVHNSGNDPIEDYKLLLRFEGDYQEIDTVTKGGSGLLHIPQHYTYDTFIDMETKTGRFVPIRKTLVGDDSISSDDIQIKPLHEEREVIIHWKLISKDFKDEGRLKLTLVPEIVKDYETVIVEDPSEVRTEKGQLEDYITNDKAN